MDARLPRSRREVFAALAILAALFACTDHDQPVGPRGIGGLAAAAALGRPEERRAVELSQQIPGLGGFVYDTMGNLIVSVKQSTGSLVTRGVLQSLFRQELVRSRRHHPAAEVVLREAQFTFVQLRDWRDRLEGGGVLSAPGVAWVDLDEAANRVVVGLDASGDPGTVRTLAENLGIPAEAIGVEAGAPYVAQTTLQDQFRPMQGGIQIQRVSGTTRATCTLGFNALWNNQQVFLTAGHCSPNLMAADSVEQFQPLAPLTHADSTTMTGVGREISRYSEACGSSLCAYSDAAIYGPVPSAAWNLGHIARPTSGCMPGPCSPLVLSVAGAWVIDTTRASFVVNDLVSKIGASTGWSQGTVTRTCVDVSPTHGVTYYCQMFANYGANDGDSGSPILLDINGGTDSTVTLGGIHSGKSGSNSVFSPWSGIAHDYGNLVVVPPPQDTSRPALPAARYFFPEDTAWSVAPPYDTTVRYHRTLYAIVFDSSTSGLRIRQVLQDYQATIVAGWANVDAYGVRVPDPGSSWNAVNSLLQRLRSEAGIDLVFPLNFREPATLDFRHPSDGPGRNRSDWSMTPAAATVRPWLAIRAPLAWGCETGIYASARSRIGVMDYLFDDTHPDFAGSTVHLDQPDSSQLRPDPRVRRDSVLNRIHGTAVAGIVTATGDNGQGIAGMVWGSDAYFFAFAKDTQGVANRILYAANHVFPAAESLGVRVLVSATDLGTGDVHEQRVLVGSVRRFLQSGRGNLFVQAVGNQGITMTAQQLLAAVPNNIGLLQAATELATTTNPGNVLIVAGTDGANNRWAGSNLITGATDIAAPASDITILAARGAIPAGDTVGSGTSLSAPFVAGLAAQLLAMDSTLSAAQVKDYIVRGAPRPRWNPAIQQMETPQPVNGLSGVYQLDAYSSLTLLASERAGIPLCGNRVWASGTKVYAQRDTSDHVGEVLVDVQDSAAYVDVFHGGRRIGVIDSHLQGHAYKYSIGAWTTTTDTAVTPDGGTYLSVVQWSHDLDSAASVQVATITEGLTTLDVGAYIVSTNQTNHIATDSIILSTAGPLCIWRFTDGQQCLIQGDAGGRESADWAFAFSPIGGKILLAIAKSREALMSNSGFFACPWNEQYDPSPHTDCSNVNYQTQTEGTDIWEINNTDGAKRLLFSLPGEQVFWLGVSEDGQQIVTGEGHVLETTSWGPNPLWPQDPTYADEVSTSQQQITGCGVVFHRYSDGVVLLPLVPNTGSCGFLQGQGTIAPAPKRNAPSSR